MISEWFFTWPHFFVFIAAIAPVCGGTSLVLKGLINSKAEKTAQHSQLSKIRKGTYTDSRAVMRSNQVFIKGKISQNVFDFAFIEVGLPSLLYIASFKGTCFVV